MGKQAGALSGIYCFFLEFDFVLTLSTLVVGVCYGVEIGIIAGGLMNLLILLKAWARPQILKEIRLVSYYIITNIT